MAIDPTIPLQGRLPAPIDARAIYGQVAQIAAVRDQQEARRQAAEEARKKAADEAAIRRVLTETDGDIDAALPRLRMINPGAALGFEEKLQQARKEKFDAFTKE